MPLMSAVLGDIDHWVSVFPGRKEKLEKLLKGKSAILHGLVVFLNGGPWDVS